MSDLSGSFVYAFDKVLLVNVAIIPLVRQVFLLGYRLIYPCNHNKSVAKWENCHNA